MIYGPLSLLVIQGTPFCNINCNYCYLPNRLDKSKIGLSTISKIFENLFQTDIVKQDFTVTWHSGEPLVLGTSFYEEAFELIDRLNTTEFKIRHNFQTNGTLITQQWCDLIKRFDIFVCVSIDGPEFIHNKNRVSRAGKGTFEETMRGISLLQKAGISFDCISVISSYTLDFVDEFFSFFSEIKPRILGLNIEEVEGVNNSSSLFDTQNFLSRFDIFFRHFLNLYSSLPQPFKLREYYQLENFLLHSSNYMEGFGQQSTPYRIIGVDSAGDFSTFSPELMTMSNNTYDGNSFVIGNVYSIGFLQALQTDKFRAMYSDILSGISLCKKSCKYFSVCGGGTPSNKYFENGSFNSSETNFCRIRFQSIFDTIFERIEISTT